MPGWHRGRNCPARSPDGPSSPDRAGPGSAWQPGVRSGGAQRANPVYRARYQHLTSRQINKLKPTQAQTVIAAAILRHLHAVITTGQAWDPVIATLGKHRHALPAAA